MIQDFFLLKNLNLSAFSPFPAGDFLNCEIIHPDFNW